MPVVLGRQCWRFDFIANLCYHCVIAFLSIMKNLNEFAVLGLVALVFSLGVAGALKFTTPSVEKAPMNSSVPVSVPVASSARVVSSGSITSTIKIVYASNLSKGEVLGDSTSRLQQNAEKVLRSMWVALVVPLISLR